MTVGDYLIAIDGKPVKAGDDYWQLLNNRLNRKSEVTFNNKPADDGAWNTRIETISTNAYGQLRYERWVKERRKKVDELSGGRVGYLHIQAMNQPSLRKFEKEIREFRNKEALVIDQRWNGGGNIEQELLAILVQTAVSSLAAARHRSHRPSVRRILWTKDRSAKLALGFECGDVSGRVPRAWLGQGSRHAHHGRGDRHGQLFSLIDGSTVRTPGVGVFLADAKRTNMENYGVQPDMLVDNTPADTLAGRDRQLEVAVEELMKQLQGPKRNVATASSSPY